MSAAPASLPPAASRRFTRTEKHAMSRRRRIMLVWNRAIHRMLDTPTLEGFHIQRERCDKLSRLIPVKTLPSPTQVRWDLR